LCQVARHTGVAGNDSHHNQLYRAKIVDDGKVSIEDILGQKFALLDPEKFKAAKILTAGKKSGDLIFEFDLDSYVCSFRHVSTHLLLPSVGENEVRQALSDGRVYVAFDWIADPNGFVYRAELGAAKWSIGSEVPFEHGLRLRAEAPLNGKFRLVRDGVIVLDQQGTALEYNVDRPGVYRVEVWLNLAGEDRPWILTNPIYVREKKSLDK
jgi:hypothetical protein